MAKVTVLDLHDWLDDKGGLPAQGPLRTKAVRAAQCIEYGGKLEREEGRATLIPCRFRPGGEPCAGFLLVIKQPDDSILALCGDCEQEEFVIRNWQDLPYAQGQAEPVRLDLLDAVDAADEHQAAQGDAYEPDDIDEKLTEVLAAMKWNITPRELRKVISTSPMPTDVFRHLQNFLPPPPNAAVVQRFLPVLMEAWKHTPRPDLDGLTPHQKSNKGAPSDPSHSRNGKCPCGSGKKFLRCCVSRGGVN